MKSTSPDEPELPPTGSFPGFKRGTEWWSAWANGLLQQANIWNGVWGKMRAGQLDMRQWYKAIAESLDVTAGTAEQMLQVLNGPSAPPWVTVPWPPMSEVAVRIRRPVDRAHSLSVSLSPLGAVQQTGSALLGSARPLGTYSLAVSVRAEDSENIARGPYLGFVFSDRYVEPLAVVSVSATGTY